MGKAISRTATAISGLVAVSLAFGSVAPASADPATDGSWYFDAFHIQEAHDADLTGEGVTIAVFDTQINLDVPTLNEADIEVRPSGCYNDAGNLIAPESSDTPAEHATNVLSYLVGSGQGYGDQAGVKGIVPDARILFTLLGEAGEAGSASISVTCNPKDPKDTNTTFADGVYAAIDAGADIISMSASINASVESDLALATALHEGIVVIASVSNDILADQDLGGFPSYSNGVVGVQSLDSAGRIQGDHVDSSVDVAGPGVNILWQGDGSWETQKLATGTSIATPMVAGFVALAAQKYPDATGNQLLQSLIRNTGVEDHPLNYDPEFAYGYGVASATHIFSVDPTVYDDVNPLVTVGEGDSPTAEEIADPPEPQTDPWDDQQPVEVPNLLVTLVLPLLLGLGGLVVGAGVIALIVVLVVRRRKKS
ncbi:S8 family peptidase [Glaciihabitans arcticus]|nr:S8/S53 family peptidase [Glaciihabitans arcticus]